MCHEGQSPSHDPTYPNGRPRERRVVAHTTQPSTCWWRTTRKDPVDRKLLSALAQSPSRSILTRTVQRIGPACKIVQYYCVKPMRPVFVSVFLLFRGMQPATELSAMQTYLTRQQEIRKGCFCDIRQKTGGQRWVKIFSLTWKSADGAQRTTYVAVDAHLSAFMNGLMTIWRCFQTTPTRKARCHRLRGEEKKTPRIFPPQAGMPQKTAKKPSPKPLPPWSHSFSHRSSKTGRGGGLGWGDIHQPQLCQASLPALLPFWVCVCKVCWTVSERGDMCCVVKDGNMRRESERSFAFQLK